MNKFTFFLLSGVSLFLAPLCLSHNADCLNLMDSEARLECFDSAHGFNEKISEMPNTIQSKLINEPEVALGEEEMQVEMASEEILFSEQLSQTAKKGGLWSRIRGGIGLQERNTSSAKAAETKALVERVVTLWPDERQRYFLNNDEVWEQTRATRVDIKEKDAVTIKKGMLSGFLMLSEGGASVPVKKSER